MLNNDVSIKSTTSSIGFAAYLQLKGYRIITEPVRTTKKFYFQFNIQQNIMNSLYDEYISSDFYNFDTLLHQIRKKIYRAKTTDNQWGEYVNNHC